MASEIDYHQLIQAGPSNRDRVAIEFPPPCATSDDDPLLRTVNSGSPSMPYPSLTQPTSTGQQEEEEEDPADTAPTVAGTGNGGHTMKVSSERPWLFPYLFAAFVLLWWIAT